MSIILLLVRLLLVGVFLLSGVAKLADRTGSRQAMVDFGLPGRLAAPFGILLPLVELVVAGALLFVNSARWGALLAIALLLLFVAGITVNLAKGRRPDCHCFGQIGSEPIGRRILLRNTILAALAGLIVWIGPGLDVLNWLSDLSQLQAAGVVVILLVLAFVVVEGWLLIHLARQNRRLLLRIDALEAKLSADEPQEAQGDPSVDSAARELLGSLTGKLAPNFSLPNLRGKVVSLETLREAGKPVLLIFSDPHCGSCTALMPTITSWEHKYAASLKIVVISRGTLRDNQRKATQQSLSEVLLQEDREVAGKYGVAGTPSAVLIMPDGTIRHPIASGAVAIGELVEQATEVASVLSKSGSNVGVRAGTSADGARLPIGISPMSSDPSALPSLTPSLPNGVSRRQLLTYVGSVVASGILAWFKWDPKDVNVVSARDGQAHTAFLPAVTSPCVVQTVSCPACGSCTECSVTTESDTATCGPCSDSCAAAGLCAQANQNPDHQLLVCYLNARGFVLAQESEAAVLWKDGVWHRSGTITYFAQTNDPTQTAIVYFGIEVTGETGAYAVVYVAGAPDHGIWVGPTGGVEQVFSPDEMTPQSLSRPDVGVAATSNCTVCEEDCGETCKYYSDIACTVSGVYVCAPAGATGLGAIMCALYWYKVCPVVSKEFCKKTCQRRCCGSDGVCCGGQCCGDRQICCNGECVDDCGGCGACGAGQECQGGECVPQCPPCSEWDSENGGCVNKCKDGQQCCNGTCWEFGCCDDGGGGKLCCPPNCSCCGPAVGGGCQSDCTGSGEPCSATCG